MNRPAEGLNEDASSILRAVGSLLVALSGGGADQQATQRLLVTLEDQGRSRSSEARAPRSDPYTENPRYPGVRYAAPRPSVPQPEPVAAPRPASSMPALPADGSDPVEFILADARERAQKILDESTERAQELISQRRPSLLAGPDRAAMDEMKRAITGLVTEVRDIQQRLGRIETLLIANQAAQAAHSAPAMSAAVSPSMPPPISRGAESASRPVEPVAAPVAEPARSAPAPIATPPSEPVAIAPEPAPWDAPQAIPQMVADPDPGDLSHYASFATDLRTDFVAPIYPDPAPPEPEWESEPEPPTPIDAPSPSERPAITPIADAPSRFDEPAASAAAPIPSPAPSPPRSSFSVVPPQRREWNEPAESVTPPAAPAASMAEAFSADEPELLDVPEPPPSAVPRMRYPSPSPAVEAETWDDLDEIPVSVPGESGAPIATFLPADGAIVLRVSPVSGFQGLMRVQDALARLPSVRQASVEAYSQGEARLRIELLDATDSDEIAGGLGRALRSTASVQEASESERQLLISLR